MKPNSSVWWISKRRARVVAGVCGVALMAAGGCESFQKKFTRQKSYTPASPIVSFLDYTQAMTPLDRYRKHYALFDYWHAELIEALQTPAGSTMPGISSGNVNPKRVRLAASESLQELQALQGLLQEEPASRLQLLVEARTKLTTQLTTNAFAGSQASTIVQMLDQQGREMRRSWYWRKVEDLLKAPAPAAAAPSATPQASSASSDASGH